MTALAGNAFDQNMAVLPAIMGQIDHRDRVGRLDPQSSATGKPAHRLSGLENRQRAFQPLEIEHLVFHAASHFHRDGIGVKFRQARKTAKGSLMTATPQQIIDYWKSIGPKGWFTRDDKIDAEIADKFGTTYEAAIAGELETWRAEPRAALALVLLLDQFSRNLFREDGRAFAHDGYATEIARQALSGGFDAKVDPELNHFFYMPFMHSESILDQRRCIALFHAAGSQESLKFAHIHHDVIVRFGRFPHRNPMVDRHTTHAEQAFLDAGGFGGPNFGRK